MENNHGVTKEFLGFVECTSVAIALGLRMNFIQLSMGTSIYKVKKRKGSEEGYNAGFDDGFADSDYDSEEEE